MSQERNIVRLKVGMFACMRYAELAFENNPESFVTWFYLFLAEEYKDALELAQGESK